MHMVVIYLTRQSRHVRPIAVAGVAGDSRVIHGSINREPAEGRANDSIPQPQLLGRLSGAEGIRTPGLLIANETRYQLRHSP